MEQKRTYRSWVETKELVKFEIKEGETDLFISAAKDLSSQARVLVKKVRKDIRQYSNLHPEFEKTLVPIAIEKLAPQIIRDMAEAGCQAGVGPMAAVAGAIAEFVGRGLLKFSAQVSVENGGDIFIRSRQDRIVAVYAGSSPLTKKVNLRIKPCQTPLGVCTSSGTVGHSLSFGQADSVTIIAKSAALADAAATKVANIVSTPDDVSKAIEAAKKIKGVRGVLIIIGEHMGVWGKMELV